MIRPRDQRRQDGTRVQSTAGICGKQGTASGTATRVEQAPKLDGSLNDPAWLTAPAIGDFRQQEPAEGQPATEKTEVRILYDKHDVYIGIVCFDSDSSKIVAKVH